MLSRHPPTQAKVEATGALLPDVTGNIARYFCWHWRWSARKQLNINIFSETFSFDRAFPIPVYWHLVANKCSVGIYKGQTTQTAPIRPLTATTMEGKYEPEKAQRKLGHRYLQQVP